jgi:hypothetical protein
MMDVGPHGEVLPKKTLREGMFAIKVVAGRSVSGIESGFTTCIDTGNGIVFVVDGPIHFVPGYIV